MVWATIAAAAIKAASDSSKADTAMAQSGGFTPYQPINIAPVGVNLGEIFKDMSTGPPQNGGMPVSMQWPVSSFNTGSPLLDAALDPEGNNDVSVPLYIGAGVIFVGATAYYLLRK